MTDNQDQSHDGDFVQSLERGLSVIRAFDAEHPKLTLSEVAMPHLEQLVEQVHESSSVSKLDGDDVIYIARVPTKRIMTVTISVGTRFPAYATSMGRVMLAAQPDERLDEYLESASLRGLTGHTITSAPALRRELRKIRTQGWALVDQELEEGLRSLAAPIRDPDGTVVAAVNVATHAGRRSLDSVVADLLSPLLTAAERIERDLASARTTATAPATAAHRSATSSRAT